MRRWSPVVLIAAISLTVGGIFYSTLSIDMRLQEFVAWVIGLSAGIFTYVSFGLLERTYLASHRDSERSESTVRALFAGSPGLWQASRLGIAGYLGLVIRAVASNLLYEPFYITIVSAVIAASLSVVLSVVLYLHQPHSS